MCSKIWAMPSARNGADLTRCKAGLCICIRGDSHNLDDGWEGVFLTEAQGLFDAGLGFAPRVSLDDTTTVSADTPVPLILGWGKRWVGHLAIGDQPPLQLTQEADGHFAFGGCPAANGSNNVMLG